MLLSILDGLVAITFGCATCIHVLMLALVLVLVGRLGSANQPFCAHKAECQTHTKDLLGWVCIFLGGGDGEDGFSEDMFLFGHGG